MLFEQLLTPTIIGNTDGVLGTNSNNPFLSSSLDFDLLDDIDFYLASTHTKKIKYNDKNEHDTNNNSSEELFEGFDFVALAEFDGNEEKSELILLADISDLDIEKYISQSAFPSPPMDVTNSPLCDFNESTTSSPATIPWIGEECTIATPLSPSISLTCSLSPAPRITKKTNRIKKTTLSTIDRKMRKKNQNKTAAEKYRVKKKSEKTIIMERRTNLIQINRDLKLETENLQFRLEQLKQLFVDIVHVQFPSNVKPEQ